jgi:hypothetical protein
VSAIFHKMRMVNISFICWNIHVNNTMNVVLCILFLVYSCATSVCRILLSGDFTGFHCFHLLLSQPLFTVLSSVLCLFIFTSCVASHIVKRKMLLRRISNSVKEKEKYWQNFDGGTSCKATSQKTKEDFKEAGCGDMHFIKLSQHDRPFFAVMNLPILSSGMLLL